MIRRVVTKWRFVLVIAVPIALFLAFSGRFLVVNDDEKNVDADVPAGETEMRPACGLRLLDKGYAPLMLQDVPAESKIYQWKETDLARKYIEGLPQAKSIKICPIYGLSTKAEAVDVGACLKELNAKRVLLETSEYHSRRSRRWR